jgi:DNA repair exonuclease SbcCD nuclease subunit
MRNILLYSDLHIAAHKKSVDRLHDCLKTQEWVFNVAKNNGIKDIVFAGDLFHDRSKIDVMTYHLTFETMAKYCDGSFNLWILLGNHDLWHYDKWDITSVRPLAALPGVHVINKPCSLEVAGEYIDFLPYTHDPVQHLAELRKANNKVLVAHLAVHGAQFNTNYNRRSDVVLEHDGEMVKIDNTLFKGWEQVWLGHYHGYQEVYENVEYIGSTLQLTFGEAYQEKYVIIYDLDSKKKEFIENIISPRHFYLNNTNIDNYDVANNFIRLEVEDISATEVVDLKNKLEDLNPGTLEIVPKEKKQEAHIVEDAKAILEKEDEMLEKYVNQVDVADLEKTKLLTIGKLICQTPIGKN